MQSLNTKAAEKQPQENTMYNDREFEMMQLKRDIAMHQSGKWMSILLIIFFVLCLFAAVVSPPESGSAGDHHTPVTVHETQECRGLIVVDSCNR